MQIPEMTTDDLRHRLASGEAVTVIDVRPAKDFREWHVPQSMNVPAYEALQEGRLGPLAELASPEDEPLVTVCGAGKTSRTAARLLRERGLPAFSLEGGLRSWTRAWNTAIADFPEVPAQVVQLRRTGKGCLSYLIGSGDEAVAIDPSLPPGVYASLADQHGWQIAGVLETHLHADHLSRARQLARSTHSPLHLPAERLREHSFRPIKEGARLPVGTTELLALRTPGHTPGSMTYKLESSALFTGDTLFPEGVGRPDLDADKTQASERAKLLYRSLQRLVDLPGDLHVFAGHVSRPVPFDKRLVGASLSETIQAIDALDWPESRFVDHVTSRLPPAPPNHKAVTTYNQRGELPDQQERMDLEAGANRCAVQ